MTPVLQQTPCASAVLRYFGVEGVTWNKRTRKNVWSDTLRRGGYSVRSRLSKMGAKPTVDKIRSKLRKLWRSEDHVLAYIVRVPKHVLILAGQTGNTLVDTDPRKIDRRRVLGVYAVFRKPDEAVDNRQPIE